LNHRFFAEILKPTPDSVDDVLVEADGAWRTADGKYSSAKAKVAAAAGARRTTISTAIASKALPFPPCHVFFLGAL
jgi:hypothetical protein